MGYKIGMDVGGTFADTVLSSPEKTVVVKVPTTHFDLSECFVKSIEEGARRLGVSSVELLRQTEIIRYSTTIGTNAIIMRTGPKLGLIVTAGYEESLYAGKGDAKEGLSTFISKDMTYGIEEEVDRQGKVNVAPERSDIIKAFEYLIDNGARSIVIAFKNSSVSPRNEQLVKQVYLEEYPKHYLGALSLLLSSDVSDKPDDFGRLSTSLVNAYIQRDMKYVLYKNESYLRNLQYFEPLMLVHSTGGCARVARTAGINTINSGPAAGLVGSLLLANAYGFSSVATTDMGGTSFDVGFISDKTVHYNYETDVEGLRCHVMSISVKAIGAGGGSIAWIPPDSSTLMVGPQSAQATPGPACYDMGGALPTVTDADLVLGYVNPDYFLGGRMKLKRENSVDAIKMNIADPLGIDVEEAALRIKKTVDANMGGELLRETSQRGLDPKDFVLFAFGGAGPMHCTGYARDAKVQKVMVPPYIGGFSAFGASALDASHLYTKTLQSNLYDSGKQSYQVDRAALDAAFGSLKKNALRDMRGEGYKEEEVRLEQSAFLRSGDAIVGPVRLPALKNASDVKTFCNKVTGTRGKTSIDLESFMLTAIVPLPKPTLPVFEAAGSDSSSALKGKRDVVWAEEGGSRVSTNIYDSGKLRCGNTLDGPAVVEAEDTTYVIPPGWKCHIDKHLSYVLAHEGRGRGE